MSLSRFLLTSGHVGAKTARFAGVGVLSGLIYIAVTTVCIVGFGLPAVTASIVGYCLSVPASFLGHRQFSFRARGRWTLEAIRFVMTQALNIAVTALAMHAAVHWLGLSYWWGMAGAVTLVPLANFAAMNLWVFREQEGRMESIR